jgi:Domain of Unknown Function (DUF928)
VAPPAALALQLTGLKSGLEAEQQRAQAYASAGIWYDAIATLNQAQAQHPQNPTLAEAWQALLGPIGVTPIAAPAIASPGPALSLPNPLASPLVTAVGK